MQAFGAVLHPPGDLLPISSKPWRGAETTSARIRVARIRERRTKSELYYMLGMA